LNPGRRGRKPTTNRLSYGTAKEGFEHEDKMKDNVQMEDQDQGEMNNRLGKTTMGRKSREGRPWEGSRQTARN
jgi:hypothetical protein